MGKFFSEIFFTPFVYVQNDQRVMGIILRYVCWVTHTWDSADSYRNSVPLPDTRGVCVPQGHGVREDMWSARQRALWGTRCASAVPLCFGGALMRCPGGGGGRVGTDPL